MTLLLILSLTSCAPAQERPQASAPPASETPPPAAPREFRGAWITSLGNMNWPRADRTVEQQKQDMIALLDRCVTLNLNAVVLQVRPGADALYQSDLEPWSEYLTGVQGQAPTPFYDPLELWITEAHRRGLELHAWFNPYRVLLPKGGRLAANSIARTHPEIVRKYGKQMWMDPGEPLAAQHTLAVILDIVRRYDLDGIHADDYYYPYKIDDPATSKPVDFPDDPTWSRYKKAGGKLSRADWRRDNINQLIEHIYAQTKRIKPWVKVGYAPFGIYKTGSAESTKKSLNQFAELYADPKLWLNKGWLDYLSPQLYWEIGGEHDFVALLDWWLSQNTQHRHVWPGIALSRHDVPEILAEIKVTRKHDDPGQLLWNINGLFHRRDEADLGKALLQGPYAQKAIIPPSSWLDRTPPAAPTASVTRSPTGAAVVSLHAGPGEPTWLYALFIRYGDAWRFTTLPGGSPAITLNPDPTVGPATSVVISAIDRTGNESSRLTLTVK